MLAPNSISKWSADMLESYLKQEAERQKLGIPPLPLSPEQTAEVCQFLESPPAGKEQLLLNLIKNRVSPGGDPAAKVKAEWLGHGAPGGGQVARCFRES